MARPGDVQEECDLVCTIATNHGVGVIVLEMKFE
jgi:hypothetical protein